MKQVSDRLGHADMMTTAKIYAEVTPKAKQEVADKFSRIMGS
ncbi:Integrase [Weissella tructae]|nr:Integrase [Weissella tructae]